MSKHGLGRGLSSLFSVFEDDKTPQKKETPIPTLKDSENVFSEPVVEETIIIKEEIKVEPVAEIMPEPQNEIKKNSSDALQSAKELLEKLNAKNIEPKERILPKEPSRKSG